MPRLLFRVVVPLALVLILVSFVGVSMMQDRPRQEAQDTFQGELSDPVQDDTGSGLDEPAMQAPDITEAAPEEPVMEELVFEEPMIMEEAPAPEGDGQTDENFVKVSVYYATNRGLRPEGDRDASDPSSRYNNRRGTMRYGVADISIPRDHRMGHLETPSWLVKKLVGFNPEKHVTLLDVREWERDKMLAEVKEKLAALEDGALLVYVHGYNTSYQKAARRMGQLTYDLGFDGPSIFFSWPSQDRAEAYTVDSQNAEWSVPHMTEFLEHITSQEAKQVIVIAHSMGTRLLAHGLARLADRNPEAAARVTTVVLAAPDIDAQIFRDQLLPKFEALPRAITLYASDSDTALKASKAVNGFHRIGDASQGLFPMPGVDLIDASGAKSDFFGHTYFGDNATILSDMYEMLQSLDPAKDRPGLLQVDTPDGPYWKIKLE